MKITLHDHPTRPGAQVAEIRNRAGQLLATIVQGDNDHQLHLLSARLEGTKFVGSKGDPTIVFVFDFKEHTQ